MVTLVNGDREVRGKSPLGFLNPLLYSMDAHAFNDITKGTLITIFRLFFYALFLSSFLRSLYLQVRTTALLVKATPSAASTVSLLAREYVIFLHLLSYLSSLLLFLFLTIQYDPVTGLGSLDFPVFAQQALNA